MITKQNLDLVVLIIVVIFGIIAAVVTSRPPKNKDYSYNHFKLIFILCIIMWIIIIVYTVFKLR